MVVIDGDQGWHAVTVRRLRVGQIVQVSDGAGQVAVGEVTMVQGKDRLSVTVHERSSVPIAVPRITVVQALIKGDRMDRAIETLTEAGADRIVPWSAANCVVRPDAAAADGKTVSKLRRRALEATKQARRGYLCEVTAIHNTAQVCELARRADLAITLHESATQSLAAVDFTRLAGIDGDVLVIVGPEGGLTETEVSELESVGTQSVRMGLSVMRASTAGTVALGAIMVALGRWSQ